MSILLGLQCTVVRRPPPSPGTTAFVVLRRVPPPQVPIHLKPLLYRPKFVRDEVKTAAEAREDYIPAAGVVDGREQKVSREQGWGGYFR